MLTEPPQKAQAVVPENRINNDTTVCKNVRKTLKGSGSSAGKYIKGKSRWTRELIGVLIALSSFRGAL